MATAPSLCARVAGVGLASDYARRLLADLGVGVRSDPGPADCHPALAWAQSGAMALTGWPEALPRVPHSALGSCADGVGRAIAALGARAPADPAGVLAERAALFGLARRGRISPGGACRLLRAADGWAALNLAREDDRRALPAWLESDGLRSPSARCARLADGLRSPSARCARFAEPDPRESDWQFAERELARRPLARLAERARWLGLAFAPAAPAPARATHWLRAAACGPRAAPPRRAPRVLDFSALWAGPLCAELLADAGADVIKIESTRRLDGARANPGSSDFYDLLNARKRSALLDFADARDAALLGALLASADVVIESARPRALAQLGVDAEAFVAARAGRVWVSITGYGRGDAEPGRVAFGDDAAVAAGAAHAVADADGPLFCADAIADPLTGMHAALAAWACWRAGGGALLDVPLCAVTAYALAFAPTGEFDVSGTAHAARVSTAEGEALVAAPRARRPCARARAPGADTEALRRELSC
jgi:crotonobetainyl-CoA:carnitine CoA-transferase CaiB-like acyl-CoA transferase